MPQYFHVVWKSFKIQLRKPVLTIFEIVLPILAALALFGLRTQFEIKPHPNATEYDSFELSTLNFYCDSFATNETGKVLYYTPNNVPAVEKVLKRLHERLEIKVVAFAKESELVEAFEGLPGQSCHVAGIIFTDGFSKEDGDFVTDRPITYKIRMRDRWHYGGYWETQNKRPTEVEFKPRYESPDYKDIFSVLQWHIDRTIIESLASKTSSPNSLDKYDTGLTRFPFPPYEKNQFAVLVRSLLPILIVLSFLIVSPNIVKELVIEKETKMAEFLKVMGVSTLTQWMAIYTKFLTFLTLTALLITIICKLPVADGMVIGKTDFLILFILLLLYVASLISFALLFSCFFSRSSFATPVTVIVYFFTLIPFFVVSTSATKTVKMLLCFFPPTAMAFGFDIIGTAETFTGVTFSNIHEQVIFTNPLSLLEVMVFLLIDAVIYFIAALYIEKVFPGEYGIPLPWYFCFQPSYWSSSGQESENEAEAETLIRNKNQGELFEDYDDFNLEAGIKIAGLRKEFREGLRTKVAVDEVYLRIYKGQITVLLGHNGAGKTTTMMMLTGFYRPTGGSAYINNQDINKNMSKIRKQLGLCPQHNVLFDTLTVMEHLQFFSKLRGSFNITEANEILSTLDMTSKANERAERLSGGMKRKLQLAIAFVGNPNVVILDEPTSGVDPEARREIWNVLEKMQKDKTILLTTHHMDEADTLGDRIAIMADGQVYCCGSPLFLKKHFDVGYRLVFVKQPDCNLEAIESVLQKHVPEAAIKSNIGTELTYGIPLDKASKFENLFTDLEAKKAEMGVGSYGVSLTTMEEVFLKIGDLVSKSDEDSEETSVAAHKDKIQEELKTKYMVHPKRTGVALFFQQLQAMLVKRGINILRKPVGSLFRLIFPVVFAALACLALSKIMSAGDDDSTEIKSSALTLNLHPFPDAVILLSDNSTDAVADSLLKYGNTVAQVQNSKNIQVDLIDVAETNFAAFINKYPIAAAVTGSTGDSKVHINGYYNGQLYHTLPIAVNFISNALLRLLSPEHSIKTINHPLPKEGRDSNSDANLYQNQLLVFALIPFSAVFLFGFGFMWGAVELFVIKERSSNAKHMQFISGLNNLSYWLGNLFTDYLLLFIPSFLSFFCFLAFSLEGFYSGSQWVFTILGLVLSALSFLPYLYAVSFIFSKPATGFITVYLLNTLLTFIWICVYEPMMQLKPKIFEPLGWASYVILPSFNLIHILRAIFLNGNTEITCTKVVSQIANGMTLEDYCQVEPSFTCCPETCKDGCMPYRTNQLAFDGYGAGIPFLFLLITFVLYTALVLFLDSTLAKVVLRKIASIRNQDLDKNGALKAEDEDVANERQAIESAPLSQVTQSFPIVAKDLTKFYGSFPAVKKLTFKIKEGEFFGLLGINGAGKTTTFQMLTGNYFTSAGDAFILGNSVNKSIAKVRRSIGYCPQFDSFFDNMTVAENLRLFARIRGINPADIEVAVKRLTAAFLLDKYADDKAGNLSGGNKRKLSAALAVMGDPDVIFLDEPTTGMDVVARRFLWLALMQLQADGKTLILTSHSMEECEALCTRLVIMVSGQFRCLGGVQYLKNKLGKCVSLTAKLAPGDDVNELASRTQAFIQHLAKALPGTTLKEQHQNYLELIIDNPDLSLATIFGTLERSREAYRVDDFSVSQTTLEQIFLSLVKDQKTQEPPKSGLCSCCFCCRPKQVQGSVHAT